MEPDTKVLFVTSEMYPFSKSGGLADVLGALPLMIHRLGVPTAVMSPFYGRMRTAGMKLRLISDSSPVGYPWPDITAEVYQTDYFGMPVFFVGCGEYFDRRHYYNTHRGDYFDNCERFTFFCRATLGWLWKIGRAPAIINANDWQSALIPAFLNFHRRSDPFWQRTRTVQTIHNLAFQGRFSSRLFWDCGLPHEAWNMDGAEFHGDFNMLKAGIAYADAVTTVSPSYASEILTPEFGCGLEGILNKRSKDLHGILNSADYEVWDPKSDVFLPSTYDKDSLDGKAECKRTLLRVMCMSDQLEHRPVLGFIGRLREQKGIDLLIEIIPELMEREVGLVVLGEGDLGYEAQLHDLMEEYQGRLCIQVGYTEELAHLIQSGSDIFLMPSRYEPCGLTQMYALRFGTPPVATGVGGLIDTITPYPAPDCTGFTFPDPDPAQLLEAINTAVEVWEDRDYWRGMVVRSMERDFTWERSAEEYLDLYRSLGADV